jgi:hypothetical protein
MPPIVEFPAPWSSWTGGGRRLRWRRGLRVRAEAQEKKETEFDCGKSLHDVECPSNGNDVHGAMHS